MRRTDGFINSGFRAKKKLNLFTNCKLDGEPGSLQTSPLTTNNRSRGHSLNPEFEKRMPFVSTVTNGESKSRMNGNRLTSTANALMFDRKRSTHMTANYGAKRAATQLGGKLPDLEETEKRRILEDACKVSNRRVSVDNYLAKVIRRTKAEDQAQAEKEAESVEQAKNLIEMLDL